MIYTINETHDLKRKSWVESAQAPETDFPLQNLPFGVFRAGSGEPRVGVAIGDQVLDLTGLEEEACRAPTLNGLMALGPSAWGELRNRLSRLLGTEASRADQERARKHLRPMASVEMALPAAIGDYSDFYASIHHATRVGRLLRPENPLLPNYKYMPVGYHGRASSIVASGTPIRRPQGQRRPDPAGPPQFAPCRKLDFELEAGFFVGPGNALGAPVPIADAEAQLFGVCLLNDWSARDLQAWEGQPLGPFLSKSFATTISPWIVTIEALEPFRGSPAPRGSDDPSVLPYLSSARNASRGAFDLTLVAQVTSRRMREQGVAPVEVCRSRLKDLYWTPAQLVAHHTSNGCNLRPGDLLGSGTVSGEAPEARACLLERGEEPLNLPTGETRRFLEDGDEVILRGFAERPGFARIGLGECRGVVEAPKNLRREG